MVGDNRVKGNCVVTDIYPCHIVRDRYSGTYSGGEWVAFNEDILPEFVGGGDIEEANGYDAYPWPYGAGESPNQALAALANKLADNPEGEWWVRRHDISHPTTKP